MKYKIKLYLGIYLVLALTTYTTSRELNVQLNLFISFIFCFGLDVVLTKKVLPKLNNKNKSNH